MAIPARIQQAVKGESEMLHLPVRPMLAKASPPPVLGDEERWPYPFGKPRWVFEPKYDGYRFTAFCRPGQRPLIWSRPGREVSEEMPELWLVLGQVSAEIVIDGEVCMLRDGKPSFQAFAGRGRLPKAVREEGLRLYVFDLLHVNGTDLMYRPLTERKAALSEWLAKLPLPVQVVAGLYGGGIPGEEGKELWRQTVDRSLEGVIAKPEASLYRPGERGTWLKFKVLQRDVFLIAGYTAGEGENSDLFGSLVLAKEGETDAFVYAGKAGTGFTNLAAVDLLRKMQELRVDEAPFTKRQMVRVRPHIGPRSVTWIRPELQAVIEYGEKSDDGFPRWPSFKGLVEATDSLSV